MTFQSKIDASLAELMDKELTRPLPVLIEMREQPEAPRALDRNAEMEELSRQAEGSREGIVEQLRQLGVREDTIETFTIVNALAATLTPGQIHTMAQRDDVTFIRYNGQADVALQSGS
jgi:hypothetical protein